MITDDMNGFYAWNGTDGGELWLDGSVLVFVPAET